MLQLIDKELGFQSSGNGSLLGLTTSRAEPQPQRPGTGRSIHVNPKYLEARQKLQQSNRDRTNANINPLIGTSNPQPKVALNDTERVTLTLEDNGNSSNNFDFGPRHNSEQVAEQGVEKAWYAPGNNSTEKQSRLTTNSQIKHGLPNCGKLRPMKNITNRGGSEINRSWKNSKDEEYMWDDVTSVSVNPTSSTSSKRDPRLDRESLTSIRSKGSSFTDENGRLGGGSKLLNNSGGLSSQPPQDSVSIRPQISQVHKLQPPPTQLPVKSAPFLPPYQPEPVSDFSSTEPNNICFCRSRFGLVPYCPAKILVADIPGPSSYIVWLNSASKNDLSLSGPTPTSQNVDQPLSGPTPTSQKISPVVAFSLLFTPSTSSELTTSKPVVKSVVGAVDIPLSIKRRHKVSYQFRAVCQFI
ncbi:hypothetical protein Tco_0941265 [Tanacetum coccineum]|uniref:Uncharacterized protein n=1 Tax=Tanacetum coccineum TaxID=301880 RepID=A0ABQ5DQD6_9ASTR